MEQLEEAYGSDVVFWFDEHFTSELAIPEATARAQWYGMTDWPYVRVDGSRVLVGIYSCDETAQLVGDLVDARLAETGGVSPVSITGSFQADGADLTWHTTFRQLDPAGLSDLQATFVAIEDEVENPYSDPFPRVTRVIRYEPVTLTGQGATAHFDITLPQDPAWQTDMLSAVVFLQQTSGDLQIIQGAVFLNSPASGVDRAPLGLAMGSWIECAAPSPFKAMTRVVFHLTEAAAQRPVALHVIDPLGRRVRELPVGALSPGRRSVVWDGRSNAGDPVPAGIYFLRLQTREGVAGGRVVHIR